MLASGVELATLPSSTSLHLTGEYAHTHTNGLFSTFLRAQLPKH